MRLSFRQQFFGVKAAVAVCSILKTYTVSQSSHAPAMGQYNEDEIVGLITDIYKILIRLGHFEDSEVRFAPPDGFNLDLSRARDFGPIDARVLSLMRRLPQAPSDKSIGVLMRPVNYGRPDHLDCTRDIDKIEYTNSRHEEGFARPTIILIADGQDDQHPQLVLDVQDGTIREIGDELDDKDNRREVDPHGGSLSDNYMNWPTEDAKTYLHRMIKKYQEADWVPDYLGGIMPTDYDGIPRLAEIKRTLLEDYYWPRPNFNRESWLRDAPEMLEAAIAAMVDR